MKNIGTEIDMLDSRIKQAIEMLCYIFLAFALGAVIFHPQAGNDWIYSFTPAARQWWNPYIVPFHNPPWTAFLLWPIAVLPLRIGVIFNGLIAVTVVIIFIRKLGGIWLTYVGTLLSPPFIALAMVGNIDWLVLIGLIIGGAWSVPLLIIKPQATGLIPILEFKRSNFKKQFWFPLIGILILSFLIWGWWPGKIPEFSADPAGWNQSLFPWTVPFGIAAFVVAWKKNSNRWGLLANIFLAPYFGLASLVPLFAVWSVKYPRLIFYLVAAFWGAVGIVTVMT